MRLRPILIVFALSLALTAALVFAESYSINDYATFYLQTSGVTVYPKAQDADTTPTYKVYEENSGTAILTGDMSPLDADNVDGLYQARLYLSAANGFDVNKSYCFRAQALCDATTVSQVTSFITRAATLTSQQVRDAMALAPVATPGTDSIDAKLDDLPTTVVVPAMITAQEVREAMLLAPTGTPVAGSVDSLIGAIPTATPTAQYIRDAMTLGTAETPAAGSIDSQIAAIPTAIPSAQYIRDAMALEPVATPMTDSIDAKLDAIPVATPVVPAMITAQQVANSMLLAPTGTPVAGSVQSKLAAIPTATPAVPAMITAQEVRNSMLLAPTGTPAAGSIDTLIGDIPTTQVTVPAMITAQEVRNAMLLAPTGTPVAGSVDTKLSAIPTATPTAQFYRNAMLLAPVGSPAVGSIDAIIALIPTATTNIDDALTSYGVARISDIPTTTSIDAALSAQHGTGGWGPAAGSGVIAWEVAANDDVGTPIANCFVWVTLTTSSTPAVASGYTNANGRVTFYLDAGGVYIWYLKSGYTFTNPTYVLVHE